MKKIAVAVFISGTGSNLKALIDACKQDEYPAKIELVISNKKDALGLNHAKDNGIASYVVEHKNFANREEFEKELLNVISKRSIDVICLAGFMRVLSPYFFAHNAKPIINIHPSLLPDFKGANAVLDAFNAGVKETGCTVHYVIPEIDSGEIITQRKVLINEGDDLTSLKNKIHREEHLAYVEALKVVADKLIK